MDELFTAKDIRRLLRVARSTFYAIRSDKSLNFPSPMKIGRSLRWRRSEILAWLEQRRDADQ